ncbi:Hypothetical predicted protein [Octopus vulgaris]|uniref:Uncharacterized protein n=1 Tax=Octopus vulgaris TaxID=6645 RepID=A0AA36BAZ1_OCTVU|nr:Hypothetical predicted protein [Octopus vulgaris]
MNLSLYYKDHSICMNLREESSSTGVINFNAHFTVLFGTTVLLATVTVNLKLKNTNKRKRDKTNEQTTLSIRIDIQHFEVNLSL